MVRASEDGEAGASALYNMALAGGVLKKNKGDEIGWSFLGKRVITSWPLLSLHLDKLRLCCWVWGLEPGGLRQKVLGAHGSKVRRGRNIGPRKVEIEQVWTAPPKSDGGVYFELRSGEGPMSNRLIIEFNPAKMDWGGWHAIAGALQLSGVALADLFVERYDAAFDYSAPRRVLVLDDRKRLADHWNVGLWGPETERTGFRRGSPIKHQLYDKTKERQAKGVDARADVTRFEVQVWKPDEVHAAPLFGDSGGSLKLVELARVGWPAGDVTVRCIPYHPGRVHDLVWGSLLACCRGLGIRYALGQAKHTFGWKSSQRERFLACAVPVVDPAPAAVWASRWPSAVSDVLGKLEAAMTWAEGFVPSPAAPVAPVFEDEAGT